MRRVVLLALALTASAAAQHRKELKSTIAYIAGVTVYINAGRLEGVSTGDTATVYRHNERIGVVEITATADSSSAARILDESREFAIGDTVGVMISATIMKQETAVSPRNPSVPGSLNNPPAAQKTQRENVISGRVAMQYDMIAAEDSRLNLSQPAALIQMNVSNLLGTGMTFNLYDMNFINGNAAYALYGNRAGLQSNVYAASLTGDLAGSGIGYGFGRMNSEYVSGLGTFDGAQLYFHLDNFTLGAIGGGNALVPASSLSFSGTKSAAFVNYRTGVDVFHQYDGTVAYGLRMQNGKLDRNFLYLQNSLSLGPKLSIYETSEVDLSKLSGGVPVSALDFSNTFLSVNYFPVSWLFANLGYDAYRNVYLYQSMKDIPDSLVDRNILQGFRASVSAYLPGEITVSANGSYSTRKDYVRSEHTLGATLRAADMLDLGVEGSIRYMNFLGVYSNANDFMLELDRTFFDALDVTVSYDTYDISVSLLQQTYTTQTISGFLNYTFSSKWYSSLGLDDVIDASMNSFRVYAEVGFRF